MDFILCPNRRETSRQTPAEFKPNLPPPLTSAYVDGDAARRNDDDNAVGEACGMVEIRDSSTSVSTAPGVPLPPAKSISSSIPSPSNVAGISTLTQTLPIDRNGNPHSLSLVQQKQQQEQPPASSAQSLQSINNADLVNPSVFRQQRGAPSQSNQRGPIPRPQIHQATSLSAVHQPVDATPLQSVDL